MSCQFDEFVHLLTHLPPSMWEAVVIQEPEWKLMRPLSNELEFGSFAALFIALGLNDYQTKGKAEVGYWPKVIGLIKRWNFIR